jgi:queuine tRNA-ribosyltransferase
MKANFSVIRSCPGSHSRAGELLTPHGVIETPVFLPVGTQATVKTLTPDEIKDIGFKMILSNTYHLYLRPGINTFEKTGGLHKFMGWNGAILTDSGGYQVFSLSPLRRISDEGVTFRSHIDGSTHFLTPELIVKYQGARGHTCGQNAVLRRRKGMTSLFTPSFRADSFRT